MPYVNAEKKNVSYNQKSSITTFTEQGRMIVLYDKKITIAKADDIVDAWRVLEGLRCLVNEIWLRRAQITPSFEARTRPHALEIYSRLPRTNCKQCGEPTCFAFAMKLWSGGTKPTSCKPIFGSGYEKLKDAFMEICRGLGIEDLE
jgi:ArsR family metal-binding transcriptional regulator